MARNAPAHTFCGLGRLPVETILDVGANVGQFARYSRGFFRSATVHCFEPLPAAAAELRSWAASVGGPPVMVWETAVGEAIGDIVIHEHVGHSPSSSILASVAGAEGHFAGMTGTKERRVPITTLDSWSSESGVTIRDSTLIKLDVQGFEAHVIRGGPDSFGRAGVCVIEITPIPMYEGQSQFADIVRLLENAGLEYLGNLEQYCDSDGMIMYVDAVFVRSALLNQLVR